MIMGVALRAVGDFSFDFFWSDRSWHGRLRGGYPYSSEHRWVICIHLIKLRRVRRCSAMQVTSLGCTVL